MLYVFGDSITKSVSFDKDGGYRIISDNFIRRAATANGIELNNRSLFGATLKKGKQLLQRFWNDFLPGDMILLAYGGNDCNMPWELISENPLAEASAQTPPELFSQSLGQTVDRLLSHSLHPILMTLPPLEPEHFFQKISDGLRPEHILAWIGDVQAIYRWQENYSHMIAELAKRRQIPLFDARKSLLSYPGEEAFLCDDGMHLSETGQMILTHAFSSFLENYLKDNKKEDR